MKQLLNIDTWNRKDHFYFFSKFDSPYFGVTVDVDCTKAYLKAKELNVPFSIYYLYNSISAANNIEAFRYRIIDKKVYLYDTIDASPTVNRPNNTFGFSYIKYHKGLKTFAKIANTEIERVRNTIGLDASTSGQNVIQYSTLPWVKFTSLSHAENSLFPDSCPKISFGKMTLEGTKRTMPMSVHVHHALMDGYEVGMYVESFQKLMNQ